MLRSFGRQLCQNLEDNKYLLKKVLFRDKKNSTYKYLENSFYISTYKDFSTI